MRGILGQTGTEDDDACQHLCKVRSNMMKTYGLSDASMSQGNFIAKVNRFGSPVTLLISLWISMLPVCLPLAIVSYMNSRTHFYVMSCRRYQAFTFERMFCDVTYPCVMYLPVAIRLSMFCLATWGLLRKRLFYVFLRHKILIDFDDSVSFAGKIICTISMVFGAAVLHIIFGMLTGFQLDEQGQPIEGKYLVTTSVGSLVMNPFSLFDPENRPLLYYIIRCFKFYLLETVVALFFASRAIYVKQSLMPFSTLYEGDPQYTHLHLQESTVVCEGVAREILQCDSAGQCESKTFSVATQISDEEDISKACDMFRESALSFDCTCKISGQADAESIGGSEWKVASLPPLGLCDLLFKKWWPLELILKYDKHDQTDHSPMQFRIVWGIHCLFLFIALCIEFVYRCQGLYKMRNLQTVHTPRSTMILMICFSSVVAAGCFRTLTVLACHIYNHLL